ncbi:MAG: hemolysin activation protein, partial [Prevotella sp.]|nr:hemolysin activation protein [Prevotella sp.]
MENTQEKRPALVDVSVLLLFFNRADTFQQVFQAVREARPARLFLYQDGPRSEADMAGIEACRSIAEQVDWQCEVHRKYQQRNYGCDPSEYIAQKWAFSLSDKCIVLEDDDVPSQSFFTFCKELLDRYEHDSRIAMIAGFNAEEVTPGVPDDYFFTSTFSIWGWASWRRVVDQWDENYSFLDDDYNRGQLESVIRTRRYRRDIIPMC